MEIRKVGTPGALLSSMTLVICFALSASAALTAIATALRNAPEGYENNQGFHFADGRPGYSALPRPRQVTLRPAFGGALVATSQLHRA